MMQQVAVTLCVSLAVVTGIQTRPDFSGRWLPTDTPAATQVLTVTQNESELKATLTDGDTTELIRYTFSAPTVQDVAHPNVTVTSNATWKDSTLEITTTFMAADTGNVMSVRTERWSLDADRRLIIETSTVRGNAPPRTSRSVFVKR